MTSDTFARRFAQLPWATKLKIIGAIAVVAFATLVTMTVDNDVPSPGNEGYIYIDSNPTLSVIVAKSKDAATAMAKASVHNDTIGGDQLQSNGDVWLEEPGTKVLRLETSLGGLLGVRLLSGPNLGTVVWLPMEWVHTKPHESLTTRSGYPNSQQLGSVTPTETVSVSSPDASSVTTRGQEEQVPSGDTRQRVTSASPELSQMTQECLAIRKQEVVIMAMLKASEKSNAPLNDQQEAKMLAVYFQLTQDDTKKECPSNLLELPGLSGNQSTPTPLVDGHRADLTVPPTPRVDQVYQVSSTGDGVTPEQAFTRYLRGQDNDPQGCLERVRSYNAPLVQQWRWTCPLG